MPEAPQALELIAAADATSPAEKAKKLRDGLTRAGFSAPKQAEAIAAWMQAGRPPVTLILTGTLKMVVNTGTKKPLASEAVNGGPLEDPPSAPKVKAAKHPPSPSKAAAP